MKLLITGGAGFIGTNCSIYFRKKGYEILTVDKLGIGSVRKNLDVVESKFFKVDISRKFPADLLEGVDYIINLASESHVDRIGLVIGQSIPNSLSFHIIPDSYPLL